MRAFLYKYSGLRWLMRALDLERDIRWNKRGVAQRFMRGTADADD